MDPEKAAGACRLSSACPPAALRGQAARPHSRRQETLQEEEQLMSVWNLQVLLFTKVTKKTLGEKALKSTTKKELAKAGRVADFLELGELFAKDALEREESCGGHFRDEYQTKEGEATRKKK